MPEITEQELEIFNEYQKLGTPQEVFAALGERETMKRSNSISEAARLLGYKAKVLDKLAKDVEVYVEGDKAYVKVDGVETPLQEFAEQEWGDFLPSLKEEANSNRPQVPYIAQSAQERESGTKNAGKKFASNYITQRYGSVLTDSVH